MKASSSEACSPIKIGRENMLREKKIKRESDKRIRED
jgi:hypothetical protein